MLLYLPIVVLILFSFNQAKYSLQWQGFSFHWYRILMEDRSLWSALFHSVLLGTVTAIITTMIGLFSSIHCFARTRYQPRLLNTLLIMMVIIPDIVFGVALLIFFQFMHLKLGFVSLLIAHITFCLPFVVLTINTRLKTLDKNIYDSALDLGASHWGAVSKIMIPLLSPSIISALLLCFTLSFDDVIVSYFIAGPDFSILPLTIFSLVRSGVTPELNALCAFTLGFSMLLVLISQYYYQREL
jgi:spermidine/putrescine transport system permease protein